MTLLGLLLVIIALALAVVAFLYFAPQFGAKPRGASLQAIQASKNQLNGIFVNIVGTEIDTREPGEPMDFHTYLFPAKGKNPSKPIPTQQFSGRPLTPEEIVWLGHSTVLFNSGGLNIVTDPVFNRASPIPIGGKPFSMTSTPTIEALPEIDVVLISHDHYDHLDSLAITKLATKTKLFLVPLGIRAHLERWGVPPQNIVELDWYESHSVAEAMFTLTPARHFSGRGLTNRNTTLWGSWVTKTNELSVFYSGDSGYFDEFSVIGERFGPFDIAFIENGAYDSAWAQIHMMPEQSVQAAVELNAKVFFPIHWGKFDLAKHQWNEPIIRAVNAAKKQNMPVAAPMIGQVFKLTKIPFEKWWE